MPEIVDAIRENENYFGIVKLTIGDESRAFKFGVHRKSYACLKRILSLRPLDNMPGLTHKYYFAGAVFSLNDGDSCQMLVRVEEGRWAKQVRVTSPKALVANLQWAKQVSDFKEVAHLVEVE